MLLQAAPVPRKSLRIIPLSVGDACFNLWTGEKAIVIEVEDSVGYCTMPSHTAAEKRRFGFAHYPGPVFEAAIKLRRLNKLSEVYVDRMSNFHKLAPAKSTDLWFK